GPGAGPVAASPGASDGGADGTGHGGAYGQNLDSTEPRAVPRGAAPAPAYRGDTSRALADVRGWLGEGWRVVLVTEGPGPAQRLAEMLRGEGLGARLGDLTEPPEPGVPSVTTALIPNGFTWESVRLAVLT